MLISITSVKSAVLFSRIVQKNVMERTNHSGVEGVERESPKSWRRKEIDLSFQLFIRATAITTCSQHQRRRQRRQRQHQQHGWFLQPSREPYDPRRHLPRHRLHLFHHHSLRHPNSERMAEHDGNHVCHLFANYSTSGCNID